jgi:hypothetical protein
MRLGFEQGSPSHPGFQFWVHERPLSKGFKFLSFRPIIYDVGLTTGAVMD